MKGLWCMYLQCHVGCTTCSSQTKKDGCGRLEPQNGAPVVLAFNTESLFSKLVHLLVKNSSFWGAQKHPK